MTVGHHRMELEKQITLATDGSERFHSEFPRLLGCLRGEAQGATLLCIAGIHGNEPAGILGLRRVFDNLTERKATLRGEIVGIAGNLHALAQRVRFIDKDLNRQWAPSQIHALGPASLDGELPPELIEQIELHEMILGVLARRRGPVICLDLHTTSSDSVPFGVIGDTLPNREFALHYPVPIILGLEEQLEGTLPEYLYRLGCITMGFEAGQHDDPVSVELHEAAIWLALAAANVIDASDFPEVDESRQCLAAAAQDCPRFLEILDRHRIRDRSEFRMMPGYANFQSVQRGELLAHGLHGELRAGQPAMVCMPLYQDQGDDGYFLARPVRPAWLKLSSALRRLGVASLAHWLPGVRRHASRPNTVTVRPHVARWYAREVFHLLGYRQQHAENGLHVFSRREHDVWQREATPGDAISAFETDDR